MVKINSWKLRQLQNRFSWKVDKAVRFALQHCIQPYYFYCYTCFLFNLNWIHDFLLISFFFFAFFLFHFFTLWETD